MKIRTKLAIAFLTITVVPITLIYMAIIGLNNYQARPGYSARPTAFQRMWICFPAHPSGSSAT